MLSQAGTFSFQIRLGCIRNVRGSWFPDAIRGIRLGRLAFGLAGLSGLSGLVGDSRGS